MVLAPPLTAAQGCLLALILGGGDPATTFAVNNTFSRTKAYMTFILAFVAITSIVVSRADFYR